uniref:Uncharacterized protein n=1 Tax=Ixodes ricinus TaxID=34613 RepID=A0A090X9X6_IXORI
MFSVPRIAAVRASTTASMCGPKIRMTSSRSADAGDDRMQKHEASEVAFSPTRLEDITHNYKNSPSDDATPAGQVSENADAYGCASNVNLVRAYAEQTCLNPSRRRDAVRPASTCPAAAAAPLTTYLSRKTPICPVTTSEVSQNFIFGLSRRADRSSDVNN